VKQTIITSQFVEFIPNTIEEGIIYITMTYATAVHKCCCGCGQEVVTPFTPTDWKLIFDGETVSLNPSIGNWGFDCRSHYWIRENKVIWSSQWSQQAVKRGRANNQAEKKRFFGDKSKSANEDPTGNREESADGKLSGAGRAKWKSWFA
jgi:hypothetical protein